MARFSLIASASLCLLIASPALAIQGPDTYEHVPGARAAAVNHPATQDRLTAGAAWQAFLARHGSLWQVRWDEATRTPARFSGEGWPVDELLLERDASAFSLSTSILTELRPLMGLQASEFQALQPLVVDRHAGITTVTFAQYWHGIAVEDSRISLRFKAGRFVMGQLEVLPGIDVPRQGQVTEASALARAVGALGWAPTEFEVAKKGELRIFPVRGDHGVDYHLAWRFELRSTTEPSYRIVWVDAEGEPWVAWREQLRFVGARVQGERDNRYPANGLTQAPMAFTEIEIPSGSVDADHDGWFEIDRELPIDVSWSTGSEWARIRNMHDDGTAVFEDEVHSDGDVVTASPGSDLSNSARRRIRAQIDAHIATHEVRERALKIQPDFPWAQERAIVRVNNDESRCNAWFDEESRINFVRQGQGCHNTARIADVIYHEYGHGFHLWNIIEGAGGWGDGSLGEGLSDYMSATITGSTDLAPGFFTSGTQALRDLDSGLRWPEDIAEDPHITGLIIAGALWDLRELLVSAYGEDEGIPHADFLYWNVAMRAADIPDAYDEVLLADDDNGNLADGTPNQCFIDEAFGAHGLGAGSAGTGLAIVRADHTPPEISIEPEVDFAMSVDASVVNPDCAESQIGSVRLRYSHDGEGPLYEFIIIDLGATADDHYEGLLPGAAPGSFVRYFIEVLDEEGRMVSRLPEGSVTDPWYGIWVGPLDIVAEFDFEDDDGGFVHELIEGPDQEGADDWQWGQPGGRGGDPNEAFSGSLVWGTDLSPEEHWNGQYQPGIHSVLTSAEIPVPEEADVVHLQFRRWLGVEDGFFDQAEVRVNGHHVWTQFASNDADDADQHHQDMHWAFRSYDITDTIGIDGTVQVEWTLISDGGLELGGWTLDDVRVVLPGEWADPDDGTDDDDVPYFEGLRAEGSGCACSATPRARNHWSMTLLALCGLILVRRSRP